MQISDGIFLSCLLPNNILNTTHKHHPSQEEFDMYHHELRFLTPTLA